MRETAPQYRQISQLKKSETSSGVFADLISRFRGPAMLGAAILATLSTGAMADTNQPTFNAKKLYAEGQKDIAEGKRDIAEGKQKVQRLAEVRRKRSELEAQLAALERGK